MNAVSLSGTSILVINSGSSSVKFALFAAEQKLPRLFSGAMERIGLAHGHFHTEDPTGKRVIDDQVSLPSHRDALELLLSVLTQQIVDVAGLERTQTLQKAKHAIIIPGIIARFGGRHGDKHSAITEILRQSFRESGRGTIDGLFLIKPVRLIAPVHGFLEIINQPVHRAITEALPGAIIAEIKAFIRPIQIEMVGARQIIDSSETSGTNGTGSPRNHARATPPIQRISAAS